MLNSWFLLSAIFANQNLPWVIKQNLSTLAYTLLVVAQFLERRRERNQQQLACSWYRTKIQVSKAVFVAHVCGIL